jgi:hypothetical protein
MIFYCPYCGNNLKSRIRLSSAYDNKLYGRCILHKNHEVRFWLDLNSMRITDYSISNEKYLVEVYKDKNSFCIYDRNLYKKLGDKDMQGDPVLTPENFESKLKTYLSFL